MLWVILSDIGFWINMFSLILILLIKLNIFVSGTRGVSEEKFTKSLGLEKHIYAPPTHHTLPWNIITESDVVRQNAAKYSCFNCLCTTSRLKLMKYFYCKNM